MVSYRNVQGLPDEVADQAPGSLPAFVLLFFLLRGRQARPCLPRALCSELGVCSERSARRTSACLWVEKAQLERGGGRLEEVWAGIGVPENRSQGMPGFNGIPFLPSAR
ncbi:hypothetical protein MHYP_G00240170 [Metynnis hypsauchen]